MNYWPTPNDPGLPPPPAVVSAAPAPVTLLTVGAGIGLQLAVDANYLYYGNGTHIGRCNHDGTANNANWFATGGNVVGIAVDAAHLYYAIPNVGIGRANLDGSAPAGTWLVPADVGVNSPSRLWVDATYIYWTNVGAGSIGRANIDSTVPNASFITGCNGNPWHFVSDGSTYLYWSEDWGYGWVPGPGGLNGGRIARAKYDGTSVDHLWVDPSVSDGPTGVATDGTFVYWIDFGYNGSLDPAALYRPRIGRVYTDGSDRNPSYAIVERPKSNANSWALAYYNQTLYWTVGGDILAVPCSQDQGPVRSATTAAGHLIPTHADVGRMVGQHFPSMRSGPRTTWMNPNLMWLINSGTANPTINMLYAVKVYITEPTLLKSMMVRIGGTASGNVLLGVYDAKGNRVAWSASTAVTTGQTIATLASGALKIAYPDFYYLIAMFDNNVVQPWWVRCEDECYGVGNGLAQGSFVTPTSIVVPPTITVTGQSVPHMTVRTY